VRRPREHDRIRLGIAENVLGNVDGSEQLHAVAHRDPVFELRIILANESRINGIRRVPAASRGKLLFLCEGEGAAKQQQSTHRRNSIALRSCRVQRRSPRRKFVFNAARADLGYMTFLVLDEPANTRELPDYLRRKT